MRSRSSRRKKPCVAQFRVLTVIGTAGQIELLAGSEWYLKGDEFDLQRIADGWNEKLSAALAKDYDGMRVSGNAFWLGRNTGRRSASTSKNSIDLSPARI